MSFSPFKKIRSKVLYRNPWIRLEEHHLEVRDSGHRFTYSYLSSAPSVMVVALTPEKEIVLVRQYRYPSREYAYELPGGGTGGATPRQAARQELREETGYRASRLRKLGEFVVYCGLSDEVCHVYLANGLRPGPPRREATERISVESVSYGRLLRMIREGSFRDGMGLAALRLAHETLEAELGAP